jgi:adenylate cyclase
MDPASLYDRISDFIDRVAALGDTPSDDADLRVRKHALAVTALGLVTASLVWILIGLLVHRPLLATASVYFAAALLVGLAAMAKLKVFVPVVRGTLLAGMIYVFLGHVSLGGLAAGGGSLVWGILPPVSAVLYFDRRQSLKWFGGYAAMVVAAIVFDGLIASVSPASWQVAPVWLFAFNLLGPALIVLLLVRFVDGQRLEAQQQTSALLHNMLPATIAARLARGERLIADNHPSATVIFADVVDFTGMAASTPPRDLLLILNQMFSTFDRLAARHGLEKIKTMGDAFIAVAGAPEPRSDHAKAAVEMGIEMHRAVARLGGLRRRGLRLRVGIASGPIVAGVIGENKWAYDVWGDAVNMASRMESYGVPGMVQIAASTRELLDDTFPLKLRTVDVKGRGLMATYLIDPAEAPRFYRRPDAAEDLSPVDVPLVDPAGLLSPAPALEVAPSGYAAA